MKTNKMLYERNYHQKQRQKQMQIKTEKDSQKLKNAKYQNMMSFDLKDYISSNYEMKSQTQRLPKSRSKKSKSKSKNKRALEKEDKILDKKNNALEEMLKKQLKRPIGAIADEIGEFIEEDYENFETECYAEAENLLENRTSEEVSAEKRSDSQILEDVEFYAQHKILISRADDKLVPPENLVKTNSVNVFTQMENLLRRGLNVCVYGQGSNIRSIRNSVIRSMNDDHMVFEMLGFAKKTVFRNLIARFMTLVVDEKLIKINNKSLSTFRTRIEKAKKPSIEMCFKFLITVLKDMSTNTRPKLMFVIYKLDKLIEREADFLPKFYGLWQGFDVKILFTIENFQTFWQKTDPNILNKLMVNFFNVNSFEIQSFELESLCFNFNVDSCETNFYSFVSIYSAFDDKLKEFMFRILIYFEEEGKRQLDFNAVFQAVYSSLVVTNKNQFKQFLREPISHGIFEQKKNYIKHFYTNDTLKRIIYKMLELDTRDQFSDYKISKNIKLGTIQQDDSYILDDEDSLKSLKDTSVEVKSIDDEEKDSTNIEIW